MKSFFKKISLLAPIALLFLVGTANAGGYIFDDVSSLYPYWESVNALKNDKVVQGYPDGTYKPDTTMNRAEFVKIVVAAKVSGSSGANCFSDVKNDWYAKYVCAAKARGWIAGYPDGTFQPFQNINVAEASKILTKAFSLQAGASGQEWFAPYVRAAESKKAIPTSIDYVNRKVTRGEMAEMVWRLDSQTETKPAKTYESLTSDFPAIASCEELQEKYEMRAYSQLGSTEGGKVYYDTTLRSLGIGGATMGAPTMAPMAMEAAEGEGEADLSGSSDYSSTNVQVEGVDEADIVKNDGQYIYLLKGSTVRIVKVFPPTDMQELLKIEFDRYLPAPTIDDPYIGFAPMDMYVDGNDLVVIGNYSADSKSKTKVFIFDISSRSQVTMKRTVEFDGYNVSSRKIGDNVYLVMNDTPFYRIMPLLKTGPALEPKVLLPNYLDSKVGRELPVAPCSQVHFYPQYEDMNYLVIASVPLSGADTQTVKREVFMGSGDQVYASLENLYVTTERYDYNEQVRYDIWMPPVTNSKTMIYRFSLDPSNIEYKGTGSVPGYVKNQFSMDEHGNYFRIATTTGEVWGGTSSNNVYVLDKDNLENIVGKLENIAQGETIYSVRFMGDRAYMVTFKKIDPFFVIDLSSASNPQILGYLKIPGYSDYLHPFDENHIIGFGKDAVDPQEAESFARQVDFAWYQGMKVALFDVTDVESPRVMHQVIIGDRGTDSELLYNHKALFFDKARGLLSFPVNVYEIADKTGDEYTGSTYGEQVFQGAYVYSLDLENGFTERARISHFPDGFQFNNYSGDQNYYQTFFEQTISRIVRIGESLYTVSPGTVKAWATADMSAQGSATLEPLPQEPIYYGEPWPL